jgi:hypothetical protein
MTARDELAAAASTIDGITVTAGFRQVTAPGDGFVQRSTIATDPSGFGWLQTWRIFVCAGQDMAAAEAFYDEHAAQLLTALRRQLLDLALEPQELVYGTATTNALVLTGTRELQE